MSRSRSAADRLGGPSVAERIRDFNAGRDPERLAMKYAGMAESAFAFLRGTCHLFWQDWPRKSPLDDAPLGWICGDLHLDVDDLPARDDDEAAPSLTRRRSQRGGAASRPTLAVRPLRAS